MADLPRPEISIVIPNWNGEALLEEGLASIWDSASLLGYPFEIIIVDDFSEDDSIEIIQDEFPNVRLIRNPRNLGFARTSNNGAQAAHSRIIIILNNDIIVPQNFVSVLTAPFFAKETEQAERPLFAVGAKVMDWQDGTPCQLCMTPIWQRSGVGKKASDPSEQCESPFLESGAIAFDRDLFLSLGGFDDVYSPGYWEDFDISYRAFKAGWRVIYEPKAVAKHRNGASMQRFYTARELALVHERNRLFFNWLNLENPLLFWRHILMLPLVWIIDILLLRGLFGPISFLQAIWALPKLYRSQQARHRNDPPQEHSDREIIQFRYILF